MSIEYTLSIMKPDAVRKNLIGKINAQFEESALKIVAAKMLHLDQKQAELFYDIHRSRPFFPNLVAFMSSGPILVQVLKGENAVTKNREIMGATNPKEAAAGTLRALYADSIDENIVHGSDSLENAKTEVSFFFQPNEICDR